MIGSTCRCGSVTNREHLHGAGSAECNNNGNSPRHSPTDAASPLEPIAAGITKHRRRKSSVFLPDGSIKDDVASRLLAEAVKAEDTPMSSPPVNGFHVNGNGNVFLQNGFSPQPQPFSPQQQQRVSGGGGGCCSNGKTQAQATAIPASAAPSQSFDWQGIPVSTTVSPSPLSFQRAYVSAPNGYFTTPLFASAAAASLPVNPVGMVSMLLTLEEANLITQWRASRASSHPQSQPQAHPQSTSPLSNPGIPTPFSPTATTTTTANTAGPSTPFTVPQQQQAAGQSAPHHGAVVGDSDCACGDGCLCIGCKDHPYNEHMLSWVRAQASAAATLNPSSPEHGDAPAPHPTAGLPPTTAAAGSCGKSSSISLATIQQQQQQQQHMQQDEFMATTPTPSNTTSTAQELDPGEYYTFSYNFASSECSSSKDGCRCGDGCTCLGCLMHTSHDTWEDAGGGDGPR